MVVRTRESSSARVGQEGIEPGAELVFGKSAGPCIRDAPVGGDEDGHRLIGDAVLLEYVLVLVQPPEHLT